MKKYFKKNKVYFGDTVMEVRKLKKKDDFFISMWIRMLQIIM